MIPRLTLSKNTVNYKRNISMRQDLSDFMINLSTEVFFESRILLCSFSSSTIIK